MTKPRIAAIICTYNRDYYLGDAIDSLLNQTYDNFEVLVVDNCSSDSTKEVVKSRLSDPRLTYIYEPILGLSVARNTGAKATTASILAYLDDDAVASPQWLKVLGEAYADNDSLAIAGGKITLIWPEGTTHPQWLSKHLTIWLGAYNLGDKAIYIENPSLTPRGLNYSIRRTFLEEIGGFDPKLGRVGTNLLSNEELFMTDLALKKGWQVAYLPEAIVAHNVAPERLHPKWFLQRSWWQGVSECYQEETARTPLIRQLGRGGKKLMRQLYKSLINIKDPALFLGHLIFAYGKIGYLTTVIETRWRTSKADFDAKT